VAMMGRMGFELHPVNMTEEELAFSKAAVETYKHIRPVVQQGDLYRLISPYETNYAALMYVSPDRRRAILFAYCHTFMKAYAQPKVRFQGLDADRKYTLTEINLEDGWQHARQVDGKTLTGDTLMNAGIEVSLDGSCRVGSLQGDYDSAVFELLAAE